MTDDYVERRTAHDMFACAWSRTRAVRRAAAPRVVPDGCADVMWHRESGRLFVAGPDTYAHQTSLRSRASWSPCGSGRDGRPPGWACRRTRCGTSGWSSRTVWPALRRKAAGGRAGGVRLAGRAAAGHAVALGRLRGIPACPRWCRWLGEGFRAGDGRCGRAGPSGSCTGGVSPRSVTGRRCCPACCGSTRRCGWLGTGSRWRRSRMGWGMRTRRTCLGRSRRWPGFRRGCCCPDSGRCCLSPGRGACRRSR